MELFAILWSGVLILASVLVQHINTAVTKGPMFVMGDRSQPLTEAGFTGRARRTLQNNLEAAGMFIPAALCLVFTSQSGGETIPWICLVFVIVRTTYTIGYWINVSILRSFSWVFGMICIAALTTMAFQSILAQMPH